MVYETIRSGPQTLVRMACKDCKTCAPVVLVAIMMAATLCFTNSSVMELAREVRDMSGSNSTASNSSDIRKTVNQLVRSLDKVSVSLESVREEFDDMKSSVKGLF